VPKMYFVHTDHLNTPRLITSDTGQAVWSWANDDPYGNNAPNENPSGAGNFTCNLRLPGQYFDTELGTHYNYFRDYDPLTGRYVQSDPIGLLGGVNTYAYVAGNPMNHIDPFGLYSFSDFRNDVRDATGGCSNNTFANDVLNNFVDVQDRTSPVKTGLSLGLGGAFAQQYGGLTAFGAVAAAWRDSRAGFTITGIGSRTFLQAAATAGGTWAINFVLIKGSFDAGVLAGSVLRTGVNRLASTECGCSKQ